MDVTIQNNFLVVETTYNADLRLKNRRVVDKHACFKPNEGWVIVERYLQAAYFKSDEFEPIYIVRRKAKEGYLWGLVKSKLTDVWVTYSPKIPKRADVAVRLWECLLNWTCKLFEELDKQNISLPYKSLEIELEINISEDFENGDLSSKPSSYKIPLIKLDSTNKHIQFHVCDAYLAEFGQPINIAEKKMVRTIASCILQDVRVDDANALAKDISENVIPNDSARFVHVTKTYNFRKIVLRPFQRKPLFISESSKMAAEIQFALDELDTRNLDTIKGIEA